MTIKADDISRIIREQIGGVRAVAGQTQASGVAIRNAQNWSTSINGTSNDYLVAQNDYGNRDDGTYDPGYEGWFISEAKQVIGLTLNEHGAKLESEAWGAVSRSMPMRQFIVDRPFLVWMRRKGQRLPYLALWVENAEVLKPVAGGS